MRASFNILGIALLCAAVAPQALGYTTYINPIGGSGSEPSLAAKLDEFYGLANLARVDDGPIPGDQIWFNPDGVAKAKAKYAGDTHYFGYFAGTDGVTDGSTFESLFSTSSFETWIDVPRTGPSGTGSYFRFGLEGVTTGKYRSSRESNNDSGVDHMVAFRILAGASAGNYVLGWEDRDPTSNWDRDYQDAIIEISGLAEVPEPSSLVLLAAVSLTFGGVALYRRRRA